MTRVLIKLVLLLSLLGCANSAAQDDLAYSWGVHPYIRTDKDVETIEAYSAIRAASAHRKTPDRVVRWFVTSTLKKDPRIVDQLPPSRVRGLSPHLHPGWKEVPEVRFLLLSATVSRSNEGSRGLEYLIDPTTCEVVVCREFTRLECRWP